MMKEYKSEEKGQLAELQNRLWDALNILRGAISSDEYHFVLYFLILKRDNFLIELGQFKTAELKLQIRNRILKYGGNNSEAYKELYHQFEPVINRLSDQIIYQLLNLLDTVDQEVLKKHFPKIFDDLLYTISKSQGVLGGEFTQPLELSRFVCDLADLPENAKVYNPFAGTASFGIYLDKVSNYFAQEINHKTWAIGFLRILAHGKENISQYELGDSINNWNPSSLKYDLIVSNPPFGMRLSQNISGKFGSIRTCENFLIEKGIEDLSKNGKLIAVLPLGFFFRSGSEQNLRKLLIQNDLLDMVITFPGGLLMNTSIPIAVIVINKNKKEKDFVRFIDASNFIENISLREKRINDVALNSFIKSGKETESFHIVSNKEIAENDFNLNVKRYLAVEDNLDVKTITLGKIANVQVKEGTIKPGTKGRFVRIRDLKSGILDGPLKQEELDVTDIPNHTYALKYASLLLALRFKKLKPTTINFGHSKEPVFISNDILALNIHEDEIDIHYLISELNSEFVQKQVEGYLSGMTIPSISKKDVLNLKIRLLSKEEQRKMVTEYLESVYRKKDEELAGFKSQYNLKVEAFKELASLKHSLGRPLLNIGSGIRTVETILAKTVDVELRKALENTFEGLRQNLELANNLLERNENELNLNSYKLEEIELVSFLNNYNQGLDNYSFKTQLLTSEEISSALSNAVLINGNKDLLSVLLNDILDNAERHAFKGQKNESNEVVIELQLDQEGTVPMILLSVKNNGLPFPENFDKEKFIRKNLKAGETGNTGIGGYDIFRIVNFMNGTFDLKLNEDPQFSTIYEIELPIQNTTDNNDETL